MTKPSEREQLLEAEVARQTAEVARLKEENELLRQKVDLLIKKIFGKSSEQLDENQLMLLLGEEEESKKPESDGLNDPEDKPSQESKPKGTRKPRQATLPADMPVEETEIIPEEVMENPELYREIGEEVTEKLDYEPAKFKKLVTRRKKFVKKLTSIDDPEADQILIAQLPPSLHLPRNTMSQWMGDLASDYLSGIYRAMHDEMLQSGYLQADETPIDYLSPGSKKALQGYLWTLSHPDLNATMRDADPTTTIRGDILFQWHEGRSAECLESLLRTENHCFIGTLQTDAYSAYQSYQNSINGSLTLVSCLAHIRRKFFDAQNQKPKLSGWFLRQIRHLYAIEADLRRRRAGLAERERVRQLHHQKAPNPSPEHPWESPLLCPEQLGEARAVF